MSLEFGGILLLYRRFGDSLGRRTLLFIFSPYIGRVLSSFSSALSEHNNNHGADR